MPRSRSTAAHRAPPSAMWVNVRGSMTPSCPRKVTAGRLGSFASTSTTSRAKLKRSGTRQRPSSSSAGANASSSGELATCESARPRRRPIRTIFTATTIIDPIGRKLSVSRKFVELGRELCDSELGREGLVEGKPFGKLEPPDLLHRRDSLLERRGGG